MTQVLVVDDSYFMRTVISDILEDGGLTVVDQAADGEEAVELVETHDPDVVTMDVEMPVMDGISAVTAIMRDHPVPILMLSAVTTEGADKTLEALDRGAIDFFPKPGGNISTTLSAETEALVDAVTSTAAADPTPPTPDTPTAPAQRSAPDEYVDDATVIIGASTGGPSVVERIVSSLPLAAELRILVVQHMPDEFTGRFATRLDGASAYDIREAADGDRIGAGEGLVAKGDHHLRVAGYSNGRMRVKLEQTAPVHSVRPAIDVTMQSAAAHVTDPLTGVVLTGMGGDGADGISAIKDAGGKTIAQDEVTSAVFGIPARAIETGAVDRVLAAGEIADGILDTIRRDTRWTTI